MERTSSRRRGRAGLLLSLLLLVGSCSDANEEGTGAADPARVLARERAAALYELAQSQGEMLRLEEARAVLAPLIAGAAPPAEDLVRAAAIEFASNRLPEALALCERALESEPGSPSARFIAGQCEFEEGTDESLARALAHYEAVLAVRPDDLPTKLQLATVLGYLERPADEERLLDEVLAVGIERGEAWYMSALYRMIQLRVGAGRRAEIADLVAIQRELSDAGFQAPGKRDLRPGNLGKVYAPARAGNRPDTVSLPQLTPEQHTDVDLEDCDVLEAHDLDGDGRVELVARGAAHLYRLEPREGAWTKSLILAGEASLAHFCDLDNDEDLDVVHAEGTSVRFLFRGAEGYAARELKTPELPSPPLGLLAVDYDHEGDLDLLLVGAFGARLWRNDGAWVEGGAFVDATAEATLATDARFEWCATEDFDEDSDVDLLLGGPDGARLWDNERAGRFHELPGLLPFAASLTTAPLLADVDGDARVDLLLPGTPARLWRRAAEGGFDVVELAASLPPDARLGDYDLDGSWDVLARDVALLSAGLEAARVVPLPFAAAGATPCFADLDADLDLDAAGIVDGHLALWRSQREPGGVVAIDLRGRRDNKRAVGAVVEYRAGTTYRRLYWRGEPQLLGAGRTAKLDVLRIRWTNGVIQPDLDLALVDQTPEERHRSYLQSAALVGSCPFLYAWNGETFEFISDVLGATPLGLPIAPGVYVQPDHDEYVLVRGDQLKARDGKLVVQFTEELREVTYLDRAQLIAVDHEAGIEVFPDERFCFPPFPAPHTHSMRGALAPVRATGSDGKDWTAVVARADDHHALPFVKQPPQFAGMAQPWFLELEFDPAAVANARKLRLLCTGWFDWSDASANVASAGHPGVDFIPPIIQVPDGQGGWRATGPPVGFPAGKTKSMVLDLEGLLSREDPRLRLFCTLQLYWDRIALATCDDDAVLVTTPLEPVEAELWLRGFSAPLEADRADLPERFVWERLADFPRWDQHPGWYTRLGECGPLLEEVDDRFVILGSGDALRLAFDAGALPELPDGWTRDYLVFLDGWAKDRDPNAIDVLEVEPMPFHGMSGFPYRADEAFPDDEEHRAWRREWNTRPARRWIPPVSFRRVAARIEELSARR